MMEGLGIVAIVVMVLMMIVMCGGMIFGAGWGILRRQRTRRDDSAR
jgi:hypothetical protein